MKETQQLLTHLKRCLRARGMTYGALGRALGLSESSVKRLFADESFSVARLEKICGILDMTLADLVQMTAGERKTGGARSSSLTLEQERMLASNPSLLALFYLLLNGHPPAEAGRRIGLRARQLATLLSRLTAARLIDIDGKQAVRLHAQLPIAWRTEGPVRKLYERQVRAEFLQAPFTRTDEALNFHSAELSAASVRILLRKLERLSADFAELAALDMHLPPRDKTSIAMLMACRPWVFSMFSAYRA